MVPEFTNRLLQMFSESTVLIWAWLRAQVNILSVAVGFWLICLQKLQYLLDVLSEKFLLINHAVLSKGPEQF